MKKKKIKFKFLFRTKAFFKVGKLWIYESIREYCMNQKSFTFLKCNASTILKSRVRKESSK